MARPGIMIYFDMLGPIRVLSDEDKGRLFLAMLEYGQDGTVPQFDGMLALAWGFVRPKLDKDEEEYNMSVLRRQYATVCRERKRKGEPDISFDEWLKTNRINDHQWSSMVTNGDQWYPTTTTTTNTATATATAAAVTTNTTTNENGDGAESMVSVMGGSLGKGVVFLSQEQMDDLLDRMGIDTFDYYVDKLSRFIIEKKARVKNHYDTILKWWTEDGKI